MIDFLTTVLFESFTWLFFFCLVAMAMALATHRRRMTARTRRGLLVTGLVCVLLLIMQRLVVTDRERLEQAVEAMAKAVDQGDVGGIGEYVADNMQWRSGGRQQFIEDVTNRLISTNIDAARISQFEAKVEGDSATVTFMAVCDIRDPQATQANVPSHWKLHFVRSAGRWLLDQVLSGSIFFPGMASGSEIDLMPYIC